MNTANVYGNIGSVRNQGFEVSPETPYISGNRGGLTWDDETLYSPANKNKHPQAE